ncbi:MAG: MCE family protein [Planctomycetes bacterium]|nr:MCE family protein [Planctomycetota bacterium]
MARDISRSQAIVLGLFVAIGLGLFLLGIFAIGRSAWRFLPTFTLKARFSHIGGIVVGTQVRVQGIRAGLVEEINAPEEPGQPVTVVLRLDRELLPLLRADATASLATSGVVGQKVIEILPGSPSAAAITPGATIEGVAPIELSDVLAQINELAERVRRGEGSLGKFVVDDEAHRQVLALLKQGEATLRTLEEDLKAIRRVWPLSTYFEQLGIVDGRQLLFRPEAQSQRRVLPSRELFEPGRAVLLPEGQKRLEPVGTWLQGLRQPSSEIVIAAFADPQADEEKARILTQNQAEAVRDYLVQKYAVNSLGFLRWRKVTAAGLGSQNPLPDSNDPSAPKDRVEIVVFLSPR